MSLYIYLSLSQEKPMTIREPTEIVVYVVVFRSSIRVQPNKNHGGRGLGFDARLIFYVFKYGDIDLGTEIR